MGKITVYKKQHQAILKMAEDILPRLKPEILVKNSSQTISDISRLIGTMRKHHIVEDKALYPSLLSHSNENVRQAAADYVDEISFLCRNVMGYSSQWINRNTIENRPEQFIAVTSQVIAILVSRIENEENHLYPLLDNL